MSGSVLDRNLAALLRRAYRPVRAEEAFRRRLLAALEDRLGEEVPSKPMRRTLWTPRLVRGLSIAAAGLLLGATVTLALRAGKGVPVPVSPVGEVAGSGPGAPPGVTPGEEEGPEVDPGGTRRRVGEAVAAAPEAPAVVPGLEGTVLGAVRDAETGEPVGSFRVVLIREEGLFEVSEPIEKGFEDAGGRFSLGDLEGKRFRLYVDASGYAISSREVEVGTGPVEIALVRGATVRGVVLDAASGTALPGARVLSDTDAPAKVLPTSPQHLPGKDRRVAVAGEDGTFELAHLSPGSHVLRALHPEKAPAFTRPLELEAGGAREGVELRLEAGGGVRGRVRGERGEPLANHLIIVSVSDFDPRRRMTYGLAVTDPEGRYEVGNLLPGFQVVLWIGPVDRAYERTAKGVLPVVVRRGAFETIDFGGKEPEGGVLAGRVLDARGAPLPGLAVSIQRSGDKSPTGWRTAPVDPDGTYRFAGLQPGRYGICAGGDSGPNFVVVEEVDVAAAGETRRDIVLAEGAISGAVLDAATGRPVAGAVLLLERTEAPGVEGKFAGKVMTDLEGRYRFPFLAAGIYGVTAIDFAGARGFERLEPLRLGAGESLGDADLRLGPGVIARVRVQDESGQPVSGAEVRITDPTGREATVSLDPTTDSKGAFEAKGLRPGRWEFRAEAAGRRSDAAFALLEAGGQAEVAITLSRP
jgi:carboxypeptidase family protein